MKPTYLFMKRGQQGLIHLCMKYEPPSIVQRAILDFSGGIVIFDNTSQWCKLPRLNNGGYFALEELEPYYRLHYEMLKETF